MSIQPSIAKDWHILNNGLTYRFILRDDVYYHNSPCFGQDSTRLVIASDFLYTISRLGDENILSPGTWVLDYLDTNNIYAINNLALKKM